MRILQVCKKFPYPIMDGEAVAVRALALGLKEAGCTVDLLSFNTSKHRVDDPEASDLPHYEHITSSDLDNDVIWWKVGLSLAQPGSYHVTRFECERFRAKLRGLLTRHEYDAIILETAILATYIPVIRELSEAVVMLRAHNVEHEIWDRLAQRGRFYLRPLYRALAQRLKTFERLWIPQADLLVPITRRDELTIKTELGYIGASHVVPVGYDHPRLDAGAPPLHLLPFAISFIGSLDWEPNLEGLWWFLNGIWPGLHRAFPDLTFHIAGRKTPPEIWRLSLPGVTVHGEVPNSAEFLTRYPMMVAPILSGSGTRVKILDAMATGRVVLTTQMGLEGIDAVDRAEVLVCNTAAEFIAQLMYLRDDPMHAEAMSRAARRLIASHFDGARIGFGLASQVRDLRMRRAALARIES